MARTVAGLLAVPVLDWASICQELPFRSSEPVYDLLSSKAKKAR